MRALPVTTVNTVMEIQQSQINISNAKSALLATIAQAEVKHLKYASLVNTNQIRVELVALTLTLDTILYLELQNNIDALQDITAPAQIEYLKSVNLVTMQ